MAERSSLKPAAISTPTLTPQGQLAGKPAMPLSRPFTLIGSRNRAHLHLISSSISRNHCCIIVTDNGLYLRDLASRTGALVNGRKVKESDLRDGDVIQIGSFKFKFADPAGPVRFPITPKASAAVLHFSGVNTEIDSRTLIIGRRSNCDIPLDYDGVSNTHAIVFEANGERFIRDLGSRTGTLVNGRPIHHQLLSFGDMIRIGATEIRYNPSDAEEASHDRSAAEPELEPIDLESIDLEPIELESAAPAASPTATFPRMVETSRSIPQDDDDAPLPIEVAHADDYHSNGTIPIEHEEPAEPETAPEHATASSEPIELEHHEPEPAELDSIEEIASILPPQSFTVIPVESDPKEDSIYAMNFAPSEGIITAAIPPEPESAAQETEEPAVIEEASLPAAESPVEIPPEEISEPLAEHSEFESEPIEVEQSDVAAAETNPINTAGDTFSLEPEEATANGTTDLEHDEPAATTLSAPEELSFAEAAAEDQEAVDNAAVPAPEHVEPELTVSKPPVDGSNFTAPIEVEPETMDDSSLESPTSAANSEDFTPTLDVISADAPTPFEGVPLTDDESIAPAVDEKAVDEPMASASPSDAVEEQAVEDSGWTLSVDSPEEPIAPTTETEGADQPEPAAQSDESQATIDGSALPGEVEVTTSTTAEPEHPVRPEFPPGDETPAIVAEAPLVIAPLPDPSLIASAGIATAAAVAAAGALTTPSTKRGRGRAKAEPKPAPTPKGGRKKKGPPEPTVAETPAIVIPEPPVPAPVVEIPAIEVPPPPAPKKRGGSRRKGTVPAIQLPPAELEAIETSSTTSDAPPPQDETIAIAEPVVIDEPQEAVAEATAREEEITNAPVPDDSNTTVELTDHAAETEPVDTEPAATEVQSPSPEPIAEKSAPDIELSAIEVLEPTDPTPESAQVLDPELQSSGQETLGEEPELDQTMAGLSLTDTAFGRAVVDLGSADSAPLVEETSPEPVTPVHADEEIEPLTTHHLTAADELHEIPTEALDATSATDDAIATSANDEVTDATESLPPETHASANEAAAETGDSEITISELDEVTPADDVDNSSDTDSETEVALEPIAGVELTALDNAENEPSVGAAEPVPAEPDSQPPVSAAGDDFDLPDMDLSIDLGEEDDAGLGMTAAEPEPATAELSSNESSSLDHPFDPESLSSTDAGPVTPPANPPAAPAPQPTSAPTVSKDPFFGMNRDLASFLGGVPLTLTSATPIVPAAAAGVTSAFSGAGAIQGMPSTPPSSMKQAPPQQPARLAQPVPPPQPAPPVQPSPSVVEPVETGVGSLEDDIPEIDFSTTDEPLDLFEDSADKLDEMPDSLAPISDVTNVLSPAQKPPLAPPPPAASPVPQQLVSARPAAPPMRGVTPPPPPRSSPLRSFTSNVGVTPPPMVPGASPVSFGGAPGAAGLTAPFGAVGTPQTRQVDVFSHTAFPPLDPSVFSAPQRPASPRPVTRGAAEQRAELEDTGEETSTADDVLGIELDSMPDLNTAFASSSHGNSAESTGADGPPRARTGEKAVVEEPEDPAAADDRGDHRGDHRGDVPAAETHGAGHAADSGTRQRQPAASQLAGSDVSPADQRSGCSQCRRGQREAERTRHHARFSE